jgi:hypothetical protein
MVMTDPMHSIARPVKQMVQLFLGNRQKLIGKRLQKQADTVSGMQAIDDLNAYNADQEVLKLTPARQAQINEVYIHIICI